jgi:cyclic pyranopterin phosphate synthase
MNCAKKMQLIKDIQNMELPYLRISLTDICNAKCAFCHNEGQRKRNDDSISLQKYSEIAKLFAPYFITPLYVVFTGGEPLLSDNLCEVIKVFKSCNYKVGLTTNGISLDENKQKLLLEAGLDTIHISLNSLDREKYRDFYKVDKFFVVKDNLKTLDRYFKYPNKKINWIVTEKIDFEEEIPILCKFSNEFRFIISPIFDIELDERKVLQLLDKLKTELDILYGKPNVLKAIEHKRHKEYLEFDNGNIVWEFDNLRTVENSFSLKNNSYCKDCPENIKKTCYEGAYALRLSARGTFRLCLKREDNNFKINEII